MTNHPNQPTDALFVVRFTVPPAREPDVDALLAQLDLNAVTWHLADGDQPTRYELFTPARDEAEGLIATLAARLPSVGMLPATLTLDDLSGVDWREKWKQWFHAERVSDRVVIKPSWETWPAAPGDRLVELDPGMSFGTGQHATTRACIVFLDRLATADAAGSLLDLGCGSGILAIAAAKLGYAPLLAIDIDPVATADTGKNLSRNGITTAVTVQTGTVADVPKGARFDVVVANILAPVLIEHAAAIAACVAPDGRLILSGILTTQFDDVRRAYAPWMSETDHLIVAEWTTGLFMHPPTSPGGRSP